MNVTGIISFSLLAQVNAAPAGKSFFQWAFETLGTDASSGSSHRRCCRLPRVMFRGGKEPTPFGDCLLPHPAAAAVDGRCRQDAFEAGRLACRPVTVFGGSGTAFRPPGRRWCGG